MILMGLGLYVALWSSSHARYRHPSLQFSLLAALPHILKAHTCQR